MQLTHVRLLVEDYAACLRFYRDILGLDPAWGDEQTGYAHLRAAAAKLALFGRQDMLDAVGGHDNGPAGERLVVVFAVDDVDATFAESVGRGAIAASAPTDQPGWGIRVAHLRDPDGNLVEINSPLPEEEWTDDLRQANDRTAR